MITFTFLAAFSMLLAHELDAVHKHEWRLLPVLKGLPEDRARSVFIAIHVPAVAALLWLIGHPGDSVRFQTKLWLDVFMVSHAGLHFALSSHPKYEFHTALSRSLIYGCAATAAIHLGLLLSQNSD